jgi:hypothetical protein
VIARFIGGPMDGRHQELPIGSDGMPPAEIPCEVYDGDVAFHRELTPAERGVAVPIREVIYVRTVNPLTEGPLVLYIAAELDDWDSESQPG